MNELSPEAKALVSLSRKAGAPDAGDLKRVRGKLLAAVESERILKLTAERWERHTPKPASRLGRVVPFAAVLAVLVAGGAFYAFELSRAKQVHAAGVENWNRHLLSEARVNAEAQQWAEVRRLVLQVKTSTPELALDEVASLLARADAELAKGTKKSGVDEALIDCRLAMGGDGPARWREAETACLRAQRLDPENVEARDLLERIGHEVKCQAVLDAVQTTLTSDRFDDSWGALGLLDSNCPMTLMRARTTAAVTLRDAGERASRACLSFGPEAVTSGTLEACDRAARVRCQTLSADDVERSRVAAKDRGSAGGDPVLVALFRARASLQVAGPEWACPELAVLRPPAVPPRVRLAGREALLRRFGDSALADAIGLYLDGRFDESRAMLVKRSSAPGGQIAETSIRILDEALRELVRCRAELDRDKPEKALEPCREALRADASLVLGPDEWALGTRERQQALEATPSKLRLEVVEGFLRRAYERGKALADRRDFKQACSFWKLGMSLSRANNDLLKASFFCTQKAQKLLDQAKSCDELDPVLEYAVDGDHIREDVVRRRVELGCTALNPTEAGAELTARSSGNVDPTDFMMEGTLDEQLERYRGVVQRAPQDADAWLRLGWLSKTKGSKVQAAVAFERYLSLRPEAEDKKDIEDEIYDLRHSSSEGPDLPSSTDGRLPPTRAFAVPTPIGAEGTESGLVRRRFQSGDVAGAESLARTCMAKDASCKTLWSQLTEYQAKSRALDTLKEDELLALYELDKVIGGGTPSEQSKPIRVRIAADFYIQASAAKSAGQWRRAVELARKVLAADPKHAGANTIVSEARDAAKDQYLRAYQLKDTSPDAAIRIFNDVLLMTPNDDEYHQKAEMRIGELNTK